MVKLWRMVAAVTACLLRATASAEEVAAEHKGRHFVAGLILAPGKAMAVNLSIG